MELPTPEVLVSGVSAVRNNLISQMDMVAFFFRQIVLLGLMLVICHVTCLTHVVEVET